MAFSSPAELPALVEIVVTFPAMTVMHAVPTEYRLNILPHCSGWIFCLAWRFYHEAKQGLLAVLLAVVQKAAREG